MTHKSSRQSFYMTQAGEGLKGITDRIIGKKSAVLGQVLMNWKNIAGERFSKRTVPLKITYPKSSSMGATMHLSVKSADALEITQYTPLLIEKINSFVGYGAVSQIRLVHMSHETTSTLSKRNTSTKTLSSEQQARIQDVTSEIQDEKLRRVLQSYGQHILADENA